MPRQRGAEGFDAMSYKTDEILQAMLNVQGPLGLARLAGEYESAMTTAAVAGLVVRPTTVSHVTIWNGENHGGKSLVIDRIFCFQLVSASAASFYTMWYCNHLQMTKPTNDITTLRGTGDGREPDNSVVVVDADATVLNNGWFPCGGSGQAEATGVLPGGGTEWECNGRIIVRPKAGISLAVSASSVNEDFTIGASWWRTQV